MPYCKNLNKGTKMKKHLLQLFFELLNHGQLLVDSFGVLGS
jgi:hypothetical protein